MLGEFFGSLISNPVSTYLLAWLWAFRILADWGYAGLGAVLAVVIFLITYLSILSVCAWVYWKTKRIIKRFKE